MDALDDARPLALTGFLPAWDVERRRVDPAGITAWTLDWIRRLGHAAVDLGTLHQHLDANEALSVAQALTEASLDEGLRRLVHRAVRQAIPEIEAERVWIQTHTHFRILVPRGTVSVVPPHTDYGFGHGLSERNLWLALTDAEGSAGAHPIASADATMFEILSGIAQHDIPHLRTRRAGVHPSVSELIHRCLARNPSERFASWKELARAYAGIQSLFPPTGAAEIAALLDDVIPGHPLRGMPEVTGLDGWESLPSSGYEIVVLPRGRQRELHSGPTRVFRLDADAVYPTADARPMYAAPGGLLVDARPVTRAEFERFLLVTRRARPTHLEAPSTMNEEDACTLVSMDDAAAYARWAGKRLPSEEEWESAVTALGMRKLGVGEVWEWTSTPHPDGGRVVRGGRWRDQASVPARRENRSFAIPPAADLGFRCVVSA